ncbi:MAG: signal peptide peptidase SppA [Porticoccaceae bacterium]|nr:signal peptide peptidase SppA [Porticoccaceae bacterium]
MLMRFFRFVGGIVSVLRTLVSVLVLGFVIALVTNSFSDQSPPIADRGALFLQPEGVLVDQLTMIDPLAEVLNQATQSQPETLVRDMVRAIDSAAADNRISHLVLGLDEMEGGGISKLAEIGSALARFKATDKPIIAFADDYGQQQYFLAAHADEILLNPLGSAQLFGFGSYANYFKGALDKLKVTMHVFRVGTHKSAIEPLIGNQMSDLAREERQRLITSLWHYYGEQLESLRNLPAGSIDDYANRLDSKLRAVGGNAAELAVTAGLVDRLASRTEVGDYLNELVPDKLGEFEYIGLHGYLQHIDREQKPSEQQMANKIAVVVAKGEIVDGRQPDGAVGGDSLANMFAGVRKDDAVRAVVLRIDSPGGGVFASEVIRDAIAATRNADIPVVVSMGSVAASGGYWIAAEADRVLAMPTTITGSIGVFAVIPTIEQSLNTLGIHADGVGSTSMAAIYQLDQPMTKQASAVLQMGVEDIYRRFLNIVVEGRELPPEVVAEIAEGRVWTGTKALELGLVDQLGDLKDAIRVAAELAELDVYSVDYRQQPMTFYQQLMSEMTVGISRIMRRAAAPSWLPNWLTRAAQRALQPLEILDTLNDPRGIYLYCTACPQ